MSSIRGEPSGRAGSASKALYSREPREGEGEALAPAAMDFISVAAAAAAAAADFIPRVAMSRRRDICVCARAYTVPPGRRRAGVGGGRGRGVSRVTRVSARAAFGLLVFWSFGLFVSRQTRGFRGRVFGMKNLGARRVRTKQDGDGRDVPASSEKSNPCASRSSGTSSSASSCDGEETDAKAFDAAESGGEASRQIPRVNRLLFARDLVVACGCATGGPSRTTRARRTRSSLESSDDSLPSVERGV